MSNLETVMSEIDDPDDVLKANAIAQLGLDFIVEPAAQRCLGDLLAQARANALGHYALCGLASAVPSWVMAQGDAGLKCLDDFFAIGSAHDFQVLYRLVRSVRALPPASRENPVFPEMLALIAQKISARSPRGYHLTHAQRVLLSDVIATARV